MTLLNILQTAKEIKSTGLSISEGSENVIAFIPMNYILESVLEDGFSTIDRKAVIRLLNVFKLENEVTMNSEDPEWIEVVKKYITDPESKLLALVG